MLSKPQGSMIDKETLYDENIRIKQEYNKLFEDNKQLRSNNKHLEKDIFKYENIIEDNKQQQLEKRKIQKRSFERSGEDDQKPMYQQQASREGVLVILQKKQIKELQKESTDKDRIIETCKKDLRYTKLQESQTELKSYTNECNRLQSILQSQIQQEILSRENSQKDLTMVYKNDNIVLSTMMKRIETDFMALKVKINTLSKLKHKDLELEQQKLVGKKFITEKISLDKDKELQKLRAEIATPGKKIQKEAEKEYKDHLDQKEVEIAYLKGQLDAQRQKIVVLEKRQRELMADQQVQSSLDIKEKQKLTNQYNELRTQSDALYSQLVKCQNIMEGNGIKLKTEEYQSDEIVQTPISSLKQKGSILVPNNQIKALALKKRVPKVNHYDVDVLGSELQLKMKLQRINFSHLDSLLVPNIDDDSSIKISNIAEKLQREPFQMQHEEDAILIARYLIEENQEDWIVFDENRANTVKIVKSVFKNLIKSYDLFSNEEYQIVNQELRMLMSKYKSGMTDAIKQLQLKKTQPMEQDYCDLQDLMEALRFCDISLSQRQQELLIIKIYELNSTQNMMNYKELFIYFDQQNGPSPIKMKKSPASDYQDEQFESLTMSKPISEQIASSYFFPDAIQEEDEYK